MDIQWFPGHMAKTKRLINEQEKIIDIVYEIVDARIPLSSKIKDNNSVLVNKPHILIMSKYDLCDKNVTENSHLFDKFNYIDNTNLDYKISDEKIHAGLDNIIEDYSDRN